MDAVEVSTVVHVPPTEAYEFIVDFPRYANYSEYLEEVRRDGDGGVGTRYSMRFAWWKITYTARTRVVDTDPPSHLDWRVTKDIDADGHWHIEDVSEQTDGAEAASRVSLRIEYDPDSVTAGSIDLPRFVSLSWVVEKVKPLIEKEATRVVERIVADIEGQSREVDLTVHTGPEAL